MAEPRTVRENANSLTSEEIAAILPHRYPFALVDRILDYEPGQWAIGRKCVTRNEEFFCGHFPGQPVMRTKVSWPSSAASRTPASASRSPPAMCSPFTVSWSSSAARWASAKRPPMWTASAPPPQS